jgi:hypothetical protein
VEVATHTVRVYVPNVQEYTTEGKHTAPLPLPPTHEQTKRTPGPSNEPYTPTHPHPHPHPHPNATQRNAPPVPPTASARSGSTPPSAIPPTSRTRRRRRRVSPGGSSLPASPRQRTRAYPLFFVFGLVGLCWFGWFVCVWVGLQWWYGRRDGRHRFIDPSVLSSIQPTDQHTSSKSSYHKTRTPLERQPNLESIRALPRLGPLLDPAVDHLRHLVRCVCVCARVCVCVCVCV